MTALVDVDYSNVKVVLELELLEHDGEVRAHRAADAAVHHLEELLALDLVLDVVRE